MFPCVQSEAKHVHGLAAHSMREYVEHYMPRCAELLDLVSFAQSGGYKRGEGEVSDAISDSELTFPPHLTSAEIAERLRERTVLKGVLRCQRDDYSQCYVIVHGNGDGESFKKSLLISGMQFFGTLCRKFSSLSANYFDAGNINVNRATDGDLVAVEVTRSANSSKHSVPVVSSRAFDGLVGTGNVEVSGDVQEATEDCIELLDESVEAAIPEQEELRGRVVGILRRNWRQFAGSVIDVSDFLAMQTANTDCSEDFKLALQSLVSRTGVDSGSDGAMNTMLFIPVEKKMPPVLLQTRRRGELLGHRVLVSIDDWPAHSIFPWGHYVSTLGPDGDKQVETQVLLHEFGVSHESFSAEVMACLPPADWKITPDVLVQRTDLRHLPIVSIDPPGCKDIDDALHCIRLPNGHLQVGVHIAGMYSSYYLLVAQI